MEQDMNNQHVVRTAPRPSTGYALRLWFGLLGGALAWATHFLVSYILVSVACVSNYFAWQIAGLNGLLLVLLLATIIAATVTTVALVTAYRSWQRTGEGAEPSDEGPRGRDAYMSVAGVILNSLFLFLIALETVPLFVLRACG
jgi:hypothetical protein